MKNKIYFIAEAGVNHNGSLSKALKLVDVTVELTLLSSKLLMQNLLLKLLKS